MPVSIDVIIPWTTVELINDKHDCSGFKSGRESVDRWFHANGLSESLNRRLSTHVCCDDALRTHAFFALKGATIAASSLSKRMRGNTPEDEHFTAILLAQMGIDKPHQGKKMSLPLMRDIFLALYEADRISPISRIAVDAADEDLIKFYERFGFTRIPNQLRLVMKMSNLRKSVEAAQQTS